MHGGLEDHIREKMKKRRIAPASIDSFLRLVNRLKAEREKYVALDRVKAPDENLLLGPPRDPDEMASLEARGKRILNQVAVIKLNGGRSTTMGGEVPKGILTAKNGLTYLEIILCQAEAMRRAWQTEIPLILMNSFFTHEPTLEIVQRSGIPVLAFIQRQVPRLSANSFEPLDTDTEIDWTPPGHGDVYFSLRNSGLLDEMLRQGRRWAFISNLDNLAACVEPWILGLMDRDGIDFILEVTPRTELDRKGGTLVVRNGALELLEIAQVSPGDRQTFMDIDRFSVFNTNNVWVNLEALEKALREKRLNLPIIKNYKTVAGEEIIQIETAMGAAIACFSRARGLTVTRDRFFPTKNVQDLFVLQSDACILDSMYRVQKNPQRPNFLSYRPKVKFSHDFLESPLRMHERFEDNSSVSLLAAESFDVRGAVYFERDVQVRGHVCVENDRDQLLRIPRGTILEGRTCAAGLS
jgi:UTP--glucose-1-phosphate uridylyltransferase